MPIQRRRRRGREGRTRARSGVAVTPQDFLRVTDHLDTQVLVERSLELRIINLATLAGVNVHLLGPPGVAKSLGLREYAKSIADARYFEKPLNANLPADAVIGAYDMALFASTGDFVRKVEGYAPTAHVVFLDEWFRANGPMLDALLPLANTEERQAEHNGGMMTCPTLVLVSASNHLPDADNEQAQALVDRITVMLYVERVKSDDSFKQILRRHHARRLAEVDDTWTREQVTLEQVQEAQRQVWHVRFTPEFEDAAAQLRRDTTTAGLNVSDRRWVELVRFCRAQAWMSGRDHLIPEDLAVVEHGLWRDKDQIPEAHRLVLAFHGRFEREATEKRQEAAPAIAKFEEIRPLVEGTPPNEDIDPDTLRKAISASRAIKAVKLRVEAVLDEATREQRDAAGLRELLNELVSIQLWFKSNSLPYE